MGHLQLAVALSGSAVVGREDEDGIVIDARIFGRLLQLGVDAPGLILIYVNLRFNPCNFIFRQDILPHFPHSGEPVFFQGCGKKFPKAFLLFCLAQERFFLGIDGRFYLCYGFIRIDLRLLGCLDLLHQFRGFLLGLIHFFLGCSPVCEA